jgi:sigma-E factor negative regulatory protein RseC
MPTEDGLVLSVSQNSAWIRTSRSACCEHCQSQHTCHTLGGPGNETTVEAINTIGARQGDQVVVEFSTASLMKGTFLIYMFPILCLLLGAAVGVRLTPIFGLEESVLPVLMGFGAFILSLPVVILVGNRLGRKDAYKPRIIRIKKPLPPEDEA